MKKGVVAILIVLCLLLGGAFAAIYVMSDHDGPDILFDTEELVYSDNAKNEMLLNGVKAVDDVDGDVTASLTIDAVFVDEADSSATVVYAAKDSSNNVTKVQKKMKYDSKGGKDIENREVSEENAPDEETAETPAPTEVPQLSLEEQLAQANEEKIAALAPNAPKFYLTQYLVEIKVGERIDALTYVKELTDDVDSSEQMWRQIQLKGEYDRNTPGTYELTFYVVDSNGNQSNEAVLTVIVK